MMSTVERRLKIIEDRLDKIETRQAIQDSYASLMRFALPLILMVAGILIGALVR